jgi:hypothetical protein
MGVKIPIPYFKYPQMKKAIEITNTRKKELGFTPLKPGELRVYQLLGIKTQEVHSEDAKGNAIKYMDFVCPLTKQVSSSYSISDYKSPTSKEKEPIQILYTLRDKYTPKGDRIPIAENIFFLKDGSGAIRIHGGSPTGAQLDAHLFFHPQNQSNEGKDGYHRPRGGYTFKILDTARKAEEVFNNEMLISDALQTIKTWTPEFLEQAGIYLSETSEIRPPKGADINEVKLTIINLSKKNPKRIIGLDKDFSLRLVSTLKQAENKNVVYNDNEFWRWKDTGGEICAIPRGIKQITALKNFIVDGKNDAVMGRIEELLR